MCSEVVRATLVYLTHVRFNFHSVSVLFSPSNNGSWEVVHRRGGLGATDDHPDARWGGFLVEIREKWANFLGDGGRKGDAGRKLGRNSFVFLFFCFCLVIYSLFPYSKEGLWGRLCELVFCLYLTAPNHNIMKRHMHFIKLEWKEKPETVTWNQE